MSRLLKACSVPRRRDFEGPMGNGGRVRMDDAMAFDVTDPKRGRPDGAQFAALRRRSAPISRVLLRALSRAKQRCLL